jgi:phage terminase Nu1 subunit (DNA packaging protein)
MLIRSDAPIGVQELAGVLGITRRTVSELIRRGVLRKRGRGFVLSEAVQDYVRSIAAKLTTTPGLETGAEARARLARLKADIAEEEYRRSKGERVDAGEIVAQLNQRMSVYWREVARIPSVVMGTLSFVDREMAMLLGRELQKCLSNIGYGRPPDENGPDTDFDDVAEHSLLSREGKGVLSAAGERVTAEAKARRAARARAEDHRSGKSGEQTRPPTMR